MPSYACKWPTCGQIITTPGYCPAHVQQGARTVATRQQWYDQHARNPEARQFYNSAAWKRARQTKITSQPICERCKLVVADHVHHVKPLAQCSADEKLDQKNLMSVCVPCHNEIEADAGAVERPLITGMLDATEDDDYEFDEKLATAVPRFAAKFCNHWRGQLRGQPFELHPIQQAILRPVYGLVHRETRRRRFQALWIESGIGSGKTPLMAIAGLYELMAGEPGGQIYSVSNSHDQANHMFEAAKTFIKNGALMPLVERGHLSVKQYEIHYKPTDSRWHITSGSGAKAGGAASLILADEIHQIENRQVYDDLQGRQSKRDQPLIICATNAAKDPMPLYADLHEEAEHTLVGGPRANRRLFPVIWAAPKTADPADPATWKLANPLVGVTIEQSKVADEWERAQGSPALENRFRLQYLGQPVSAVEKWLNTATWAECTSAIDLDAIKTLPLYVGLDSSGGDDLFAVVWVWVSEARFYVRSHFWLPRATAERYQAKDGTPYQAWADAGHLTLLDGPTITPAVKRDIAATIIESAKGQELKSVCYDRARAEECIAAIEAAGITCIPIAQGYTLTPGCQELERRLIERSITFDPNDVMAFCAANVEVTTDNRGNFWPVKPNAKGRYAGTKSRKIDGIAALVTALTEARKHAFGTAAKQWKGGAFLI